MQPSVRIDGDKKLLGTVDRLRKRMRNKIVRSAVNAGGRIVLQSVRRLIKRRTGVSAKAAGMRGRTRSSEYRVKIGARSGFATTVNGRPHDPVHVYHLVEEGAKPHKITSRRGVTYEHPGSPKQPFLRPSVQSNTSTIKSTMGAKIMEGIKQEAAAS